MRKLITVLSLTLGISFSTTALIACGGDNENESGKSVDGVNVTTGKKLQELKLVWDYEDKHSKNGFLIVYLLFVNHRRHNKLNLYETGSPGF